MLTFVSSMPWQLEGRVAAGVVLGFSAAALLTWLVAIPLGMSGLSVAGGAVLLAVVGVACALLTDWRTTLRDEASAMARRWRSGRALPLWILLALGLLFFVPFYWHALEVRPDGLYAGYINIWGDWCTHLAIAGFLSSAPHVLPPDNPFFSGVKLTYPFLPDLFSGALLHLGLSLEQSLPLCSAIMSVALVVVFYSTAQRLVGEHWTAVIAVLIFFLSGGLGFLNLLQDVPPGGGPLAWIRGLLNVVAHPVREYTLDRATGFQWLNPVLAYLVPQRATLFGFGLGLVVVALAWFARSTGRRKDFLLGGLLLGLMPLLHTSSYFDLALFLTVLALADVGLAVAGGKARETLLNWATFLVPAALLGAPQVLMILPPAAYSHGFLRLQPGWLASTADTAYHFNPALFWILNTALLIPLALAAFFLERGGKPGLTRFLAPAWALFILPNLVILQPWDWDNTKWFAWWAILAAILAAVVLGMLARRGPLLAAAAAVLLVATGASGALDLTRAAQPGLPNVSYRLLSNDELTVARWARDRTPEQSIFLTGWQNNHPILTLSRRETVMGYPGWIWTWGLPTEPRMSDVRAMFQGGADTETLLQRYRVSYVVIGPGELDRSNGPGAHLAYFQARHHLVFRSRDYQVFSVA
ncbi:MAG: hypothetical protein M3010_05720 [Candidatus Dormibacteraeota bacterium]|nr:hypothetical protein [Candidatus Dormibacteraeota bacterium]